jgi:C-terminal processing protease CtpA/Prc
VREIVTLGPAAVEQGIKVGDRLLSVNGTPIATDTNLDALLEHQVGDRIRVEVAGATGRREVILRPVSVAVAAGLLYRDWVASRRVLVDRWSGGRLGYVHIADMSEDSLNQLYLDLDADNQRKDGVVVDVRHNNGGFVNGYALDVFSRSNYLTMTPRGLFPVPSRQALGQRALGKPTILLTNESSLSDAEDFTEGYRTLALGKVVGQPTAGWIIYTSGIQLLDGSILRIPHTRIQDGAGRDMEMAPRPVDIAIDRPLGETLSNDDRQLSGAVATLLRRIDHTSRP